MRPSHESDLNDKPDPWPMSIANWLAFENKEPLLAIHEFPLFTDARVTGEIEIGPYKFMNTVSLKTRVVRPAVVLRYAVHKGWEQPTFRETNATLYHGGSPEEELAATASLAMGIRFRAGHITRRFERNDDPLGRPQEHGDRNPPYFNPAGTYNLPWVAEGEHPLAAIAVLKDLPTMSKSQSRALVRAARLYQDAMWLAESEPELSWLLLVSALEVVANEWQKKKGDRVARLRAAKPELYEYLGGLEDKRILPVVARHITDSLGSTRKFVDFVMNFLPLPPALRPPEFACFPWMKSELASALGIIYAYRSDALHAGSPFPLPMCQPPARYDSSWSAPEERMTALGTSQMGSEWLRQDIPMNLHLFEYIARNVLLNWWKSSAVKYST